MNKLKIAAVIAALLLAIGVGYKLAPVHPAKTTIVYQDRVVVKDRIVTKDVVRTETRPDGTKIVTESSEHSETKTQTHETKTSTTVVSNPLTHYSLQINVRPESIFPFKGQYTVEVGKRVWDTPLWVTASANTKHEFTLGARWEF